MTWERDNKAIDDIRRWRARMVCETCGYKDIIAVVSNEGNPCWCPQCKATTFQLSKEKWIGKEKK